MNKHYLQCKAPGFIMPLFASLLMLVQANTGYSQYRTSASASAQTAYMRQKFAQNGSFEGFQPSQELVEKRTQNAKHFDNGNGTFTAVTGNTYHYKDVSGKWQDIDLTLQPASEQGFSFKNEANEFKSYFPAKAGNNALQMKLGKTVFNWWSQPTMSLSANGQLLHTFKSAPKTPALKEDGQTINYNGVYDGVTEQFVMKKNGVENNTIINHLSSEITQSPSGTTVAFSQFIPLQSGWIVDVNGEKKTGKFSAENFHITIPGTSDGIYFGSVLVFDNSLNYSEAEMLYMSPTEKLSNKEKLQKAENTLLCKYDIQFTDGGMIVSVNMSADWLKSTNRSFPVTIDPTVTITPTPVYSGGYFYAPTSNWYGYQRHADLYLASEIGTSNIVISAIEFNRMSTSGTAATSPYKVFMRTTTATALNTDPWNSATYTGGLTASFDASVNFHGTTTGWKMFTLANPYTYTGDNLVVMVSDFYGGSGSAKYLSLTNSSTPASRQAYKRQDSSDPGDASTMSVESYLPEIRLTYTFGVPCAGTPSAGTAAASTANACLNTPFNISLTGATSAGGITYQWQGSPQGQNTFTDISGATSISYNIANQTAATDYRCIVTCTNVGGSADTSNVVSVGQNTPSQCYCTPTAGTSSTTYYLNSIASSGGLANFSYTASSYSAYSDGYSAFSSIQLPGSNVNVTLGSSSTASNYYYCWVDWNNDGDFQDAGETVFATTTYAVAPYNGVIPVPAAQAPGSYRVRFALSELGAVSSSCGPAAYGNFVDVKLIVGSPAPCTGAPTAVNITPAGPLSACAGSLVQLTSSLTPILTNNYTYQWYLDGSPIAGATNPTYTYAASATANLYLAVKCAGSPADSTISNTVAVTVTGPCGNLCTPTAGSSSTSYYLNKITATNGVSNFVYTTSSYTAYNDMYSTYSCTQFPGSSVNVKLESSSTASNYYYCWVDWNNDGDFSDAGETVFATTTYAVAPYNGVIPVPAGQATGDYHVRLALSEAGVITACGPAPYGNYVDVKLTVINQSACSLPIGVTATSAPDSLMLTWNWTQNVHPIQSFNIQYGMTGFQLYSGNSTTVPANGTNFTDTVFNSNLMGSGVYQVYVQAVCPTDTSAYSGPYTVIMPITNDIVCSQEALQLGQTYTFNNNGAGVSLNESNIAPPATGAQTTTGWVNSTLNGTLWYSFIAPASGSVRVNSTAIEYNGQAAVYSATNCADFNTFTLRGANDDAIGGTSLAPNFTICGLTPGTTYYVMYDKFDGTSANFSLKVSAIVLEGGSANPVTNVCTGSNVDLFTTISGNTPGGIWSSSLPAVNASITGSDFESNGLAYTTFNFQYRLTDGCAYDSIISQVKIYGPSNAGQDGSITACKNEPIDLLSGLNGNTDLNGNWYDPSDVLMPNSQVTTGTFPGQFNYDYISGNGVCPDDTANVVVTIIGTCNWLSVDENALEEVSIYPNPSNGVVFIESTFSTGNFNLVVTDINGRTVQTGQNTISAGKNTVNLKEVERGTYFFKLSSENAEKVFRVVIQ